MNSEEQARDEVDGLIADLLGVIGADDAFEQVLRTLIPHLRTGRQWQVREAERRCSSAAPSSTDHDALGRLLRHAIGTGLFRSDASGGPAST